jgi:Transglutaminase-like superfamily/Coenzyme PQQ synthesis protein D (PqqD)
VAPRWEPGEEVLGRRIGDELILVNLRTNGISALNRTGARFWELLMARRDWDDTREALLEEFDVEPDELDRELDALVGALTAGGFVRATVISSGGRAGDRAPARSESRPRAGASQTRRHRSTASLVIRMGAWSLILPVLKHSVPLQRLVRLMSRPTNDARSAETERKIVNWARRAYRLRRSGTCLERSLLVYRYLTEASARPRLVVGMRRGERDLVGHAWVLVDGAPLYESNATLEPFLPIVEFAADGSATAIVDGAPSSPRAVAWP